MRYEQIRVEIQVQSMITFRFFCFLKMHPLPTVIRISHAKFSVAFLSSTCLLDNRTDSYDFHAKEIEEEKLLSLPYSDEPNQG
jgi:hypothetical protein